MAAGAASQTLVTIQKIREDITDLQKDMAKIGMLVDRLDTTIDKLSEFSNNVSKLIAIHETKLNFQEQGYQDLIEEIKKLRKESSDQHETLSTKINTVEKGLNGRISKIEKWMWLVIGGSIVAGFVIQVGLKILIH